MTVGVCVCESVHVVAYIGVSVSVHVVACIGVSVSVHVGFLHDSEKLGFTDLSVPILVSLVNHLL